MSISLMTAIFQTEFIDLKDSEGKVTKASTAKFVLLAMADNANDEGEGIYPSIESLAKKCALSEQTIRNTFDALAHNGIITRVGTSKYMTHNHTINTKSLPIFESKRLYKPLEIEGVNRVEGSNEYLKGSNEYREGVNPLDPNHHLSIIETSLGNEKEKDLMDGFLENEAKAQALRKAHTEFENALGVNGWPFDTNTQWRKFGRWVNEQYAADPAAFLRYAEWRKNDGKYQAMSNTKIRANPEMFMDTGWPTFLASVSMYSGKDRAL